jgi:hypothetical protein
MQCFGKCGPRLPWASKTATLNQLVTFVMAAIIASQQHKPSNLLNTAKAGWQHCCHGPRYKTAKALLSTPVINH